MKKLFTFFTLLAVGLVVMVSAAQADDFMHSDHQAVGLQVFANQSTSRTDQLAGNVIYSAPINTSLYRSKTLMVQGIAVSGHVNAALSGTLAVYCGPTATGPFLQGTGLWTAAAGVALSTTSNTDIGWQSACPYIELGWLKTAGEVSVWLFLGD